jgi:hypothetical protein
LEFSINGSKSQSATLNYQKILFDKWRYPVAILLKIQPEINLVLHCKYKDRYKDIVFFNAKIELAKGSVKGSTGSLWQSLMQTTVEGK